MIKIEPFYSGSSGNCYIVSNEDTTILLECGIDSKELISILWKRKTNITKLNACLISHSHNDHSKCISYVSKYLPIYANQGVYNLCSFNGKIIGNNENFTIGSIRIKTISVYHGKTENNAFIFRDNDNTIFWGTDFSNMEANLSKFKFNKIYIEINYITDIINKLKEEYQEKDDARVVKLVRQINTHMSLENAINVFLSSWDLSECDEIIAIHISKECANVEQIKSMVEMAFKIPCHCANFNGGVS